MANMTDYLRWRGDLSFAERPFNIVDNLVLSSLAYMDFGDIVPSEEDGGSIALDEAVKTLLDKAGDNLPSYVRSLAQIDAPFLEALASASRFANARLRAYADVNGTAHEVQFAALTIDLDGASPYVAFRGTDSSLVGWKENFMLSFQVSGAQISAAHYLRRRLAEGGRLQTGGHSKGGNLATYACMCASGGELARVERIWSNDGPGMADEILPEGGYERLGDRLELVVPSYSFVGMFFKKAELPFRVVKSSGTGTYQHDPLTWQVVRDDFDWAERLDPDCMVINDTLREWLASIPMDDRARFTNELFDALQAGGATSVHNLPEVGVAGFREVAARLSTQDQTMREIWRHLATIAAARWATEKREQAIDTIVNLRDSAEGLVKAGSERP